jgi:hypothetical protein
MHLPYTLQQYFAKLQPIADCTEEDGRSVGHMLMNAALGVSKARRAEAIATFVSHTVMLQEAPLANLTTILQTMICNRSFHLLASDVPTQDPAQLTMADAEKIGIAISSIRRGHVAPAPAVEEVLATYAVLRTMAQQYAWFEPMLVALLTRQIANSTTAKLRLVLSSVFSLLDVGTDLSTMIVYYLAGSVITGSLILLMVFFSIVGQGLLVYSRNRHRGASEIAKELLIVLSFLKPMVDTRRLLSGYEVDGAPFTTATERNICKGIETVCESVPAAIIAMVALLLAGYWAWAPILSIVVAFITTAFKVTSMTVNVDKNRDSRKLNPRFFGFFPARSSRSRRAILCVCLFGLTLAHVVERMAALTLLFVTNKAWLFVLLGAEFGLYLLYLAFRSDFIVWMPGAGYGISLGYRIVSKLMVDFSGFAHMRFPCEVGGAYWFVSILTNQGVCLVSIWAYTEHYDGPGKLDRAMLFATIGALTGTWAVALVGFLLSIERAYLWTFLSLETGREYIVRVFREAEGDDERRITHIFGSNERLWTSIRDEVKAWFKANYPRWEAEQAVWLTPGLRAKVPSDFIPDEPLVYEPALVRRHTGVRGLDGDVD